MHLLKRINILLIGFLFLSLLVIASCQKEAEPPVLEEPAVTVDYAISADGVPIHYVAKGEGSPALVFIHGWSCDRSYWDAQIEHFSNSYRVVAIDLAGHGESGLERSEWTFPAFANDVVAVIEKLELDQLIMIGHSMGGMVMVEVASRMPDRVIGLVGADTLVDLDEKVTQEQFDEFAAPFKEDFAKRTDEFVRSMFPETADPALVDKIAADMSSAPPEVGLGIFDNLFDYWTQDIKEIMKKVEIPVICINSDQQKTNLEGNRKYLKSYEVLLMPGLGHFVMVEDPEKFNRLLEEAIEKILP